MCSATSTRYVDNLYYDWAMPERRRLNEALLGALKSAAAMLERDGDYQQAVALIRRGLDIDFLMEDFQCLLMRCLARMGDRAGLIREFHALRTALHDELSVEPLPTTTSLYQHLLEQFPA